MTPTQIQNPDLYANRTVQDWHREVFPADHWAIDLDLMGACSGCRRPLYLIEATTSPRKSTSILRALAERASIPAYLIFFDVERGVVTGGRLIFPARGPLGRTEPQLRETFIRIRRQHEEKECQARS